MTFTNAEEELEKEALEYIKSYDQVFILSFSTNIDRTVSFIKSGKNYVLDLFTYSLNNVINLNIKLDYKRIFVWKLLKYISKDEKLKKLLKK